MYFKILLKCTLKSIFLKMKYTSENEKYFLTKENIHLPVPEGVKYVDCDDCDDIKELPENLFQECTSSLESFNCMRAGIEELPENFSRVYIP